MILKIEGLNSFEKMQKIDFAKLTEKGLFGIFGPTGSGKSTILDAITIALYGKITRTNKGYINTTTRNLTVSYEFQIGLGSERKTYIAERNVKVDKNGSYKTKYARLIEKTLGLYEDKEDEVNIIADGPKEVQKQVEKIIGLTVDDFTRSVVLPQGKFSDFLRLTGKEKRDMLERIFALEKYGKNLIDKIKKVRNENIKEENILLGELKKYDGISEEGLKLQEANIKELLEVEKQLIKEKEQLDKDYEKYSLIYQLDKELNEYKEINMKLKEDEDTHLSNKSEFENANKANLVKPLIDEFNNNESSLKDTESKLRVLKVELENIEDALKDTEDKYKVALDTKEKELPELIEKEANLNQAIDMESSIKKLKAEREELAFQYKEVATSKKQCENKFNLMQNDKNIKVKRTQDINIRLKEIGVDLEYKETVLNCYEKEKEYVKLSDEITDLKNKINNKEKEIGLKQEEYELVMKEKEGILSKIKEYENKNEEVEKLNPGDSMQIVEKSQLISEYEKKIEKYLEYELKKKKNKEELKEIIIEKKTIEEKLQEMKVDIEGVEKDLATINQIIEEINKNNLASLLAMDLQEGDACPVCGSKHHSLLVKEVDTKALEEKKGNKLNLEVSLKELTEDMNKLYVKLMSVTKEEERIQNELIDIEKATKTISIEKFKNEKKLLQEELIVFKDRLDNYKKEKEVLEITFNKIKEDKSKIDVLEARLSETIKNNRLVLDEFIKKHGESRSEFEEISKEYYLLKSKLGVENLKKELDTIKNNEKESRELQNEEVQLRKDIEQMDLSINEINSKINLLNVELSKISQSGKEKKEFIEENESKFNKLTEGKKPEIYIEEVRNRKNQINELTNNLREKLDKFTQENNKLNNEKLTLNQKHNMLLEIKEEKGKKLEVALKENGFKDYTQVIDYLIHDDELKTLENKIVTYEEEVKRANDNIVRIENKLKGEHIQEEQWEKIKSDRIEKGKELNLKIKEIATTQKIIEDMKKDMKALKELKQKEKDINHKLSLLNDLGKLIEGNKFVEFVAMSQLKYIAREASRRLKDITRDRYGLEIDSEGNFTVRDDFNGGEIRDTSTLSGGETFLASLSLALALSSQVQLKGSAPLEFFFLDEGFGTLDSELLDIVIGSLEKLHNDKLSVGIISHVEDLKNRVPVKLLVAPSRQGEGGSKVTLEES